MVNAYVSMGAIQTLVRHPVNKYYLMIYIALFATDMHAITHGYRDHHHGLSALQADGVAV